MSEKLVPFNEAAQAEFFSVVSRVLKIMPPLNYLIVGNNNVPRGWQHLRGETALTYPAPHWVCFEGDETVHPWVPPHFFKEVGLFTVERADMESNRAEFPGGCDALALKFGKKARAMVVGAFAPGVTFTPHPDDEELLIGGGGLGHDDICMLPGVYWHAQRRFYDARSAKELGRLPRKQAAEMAHLH